MLMKLAIMQPYFLPYIGYWQMIKAVNKYVIYDDVNYIKGGWVNRNKMLLGGKEFLFNLELKGASPNKLFLEIEVNENQSKLLRTVRQAYVKAPYYTQIMQLLDKILEYDKGNLGRFLGNSLIEIANYLSINTEFIYSSDIEKDNELRAQDKVLHICHKLGATQYYNAIGGQELYSKEDFAKEGIELSFLKTTKIEYNQFKNEFVPWLSILDILMFNSPEEINQMLDNYELV